VLATHLTEIIRTVAAEVTSRQDVSRLIENLKGDSPALVDSIVPEVVPLGTLHKVLQALLKERVPIRDLGTILETTSDYIGATKDADVLSEYVRMSLARQITQLYRDKDGRINVFTIDPALEQKLAESIQNTKQGLMLVLDPAMTDVILDRVGKEIDRMQTAGHVAVAICSPNIRLAFRRLLEPRFPTLAVISYNEVLPDVELISTGMVRLQDDS